ncbi:MAG: chromosome partitioning protein ParA, partial [Pseudomonadota bacterium]|nr:chromosome partitioning protein ParA [Pseudomonadota bacterium]
QKEQLAARPKEIETQRTTLMDLIAGSETKRNQASDRLAEMENGLSEADATLRRTEAALGESREARVRTEAQVEQAKSDRDVVAERITERLDSKPETILADAEIDTEKELPPRDVVEVKLERLIRERDNMGPVNLRAEQELHELEEQIGSMQTEREDLLAAIARLRQGISALNREGRERLLAAFEQVNQHFEELFVHLFGGGRAHLALTDAEDPLEAGLEIMASPPGKKLQIMSLLSGGEQALTALALLFAVFLTNPAPICVLDEVDAPLDDANVERFCNLLDEITKASKTRFLVVTHHRLTMAKMDRLFGVTMGERGVSQLVSVDLQTAEQIRDSA